MKRIELKMGSLLVAMALVMVMLGLAVPAEAQQGQGQFPIAVVDVNRVFRDSKPGQAIDKTLKDQGAKLEKDMKAKDDELKKVYDALIKEAQSGKATKEALEKKEKDLQARIQAFQTERAKAIDDMNASAEKALKPLQDKTEKAINELAKAKNFVIVLNNAGVVYAPDSIDITNDVIAAVNK